MLLTTIYTNKSNRMGKTPHLQEPQKNVRNVHIILFFGTWNINSKGSDSSKFRFSDKFNFIEVKWSVIFESSASNFVITV